MTTLYQLLRDLHFSELHHGDCVGVDALVHHYVLAMSSQSDFILPAPRIIIHPPNDTRYRAFCEWYDEIRVPLPYLQRNLELVTSTDALVAAPLTADEQLRSGTWTTIRYARKLDHAVYIVNPDGTMKSEE